MDRSYFSFLVLTISLTAYACGESNAQRSGASPTPGQPAPITSADQVPRANSETSPPVAPGIRPGAGPQVNSNVRTPGNAASNTLSGSVNESDIKVDETKGIDRSISRRRERFDADPTATPPPAAFQSAPENSEFAVQMESGGSIVETRVFKKHSQLRKVEVRWTGPQTRSLKVTLKNGKIVERPSVPVVNLRTASSAVLLELAGFKPGQK